MLSRLSSACALAALAPSLALSQDKPPITPADYDRWESLGGSTLSPDGRWITARIRRGDDTEILLRNLRTDGDHRLADGSRATFSSDSAWLAFMQGGGQGGRRGRDPADDDARPILVLRELASGASEEIPGPTSFAFSPDGRFLLMQHRRDGTPANGAGGRGRRGGGRRGGGGSAGGNPTDVVVRDLAAGTDTPFGNVTGHAWLPDGHLLALLISREGRSGNGVLLFDPDSGRLRTLHSGGTRYAELTLRSGHDDLAVLVSRKLEGAGDINGILAWRGLATGGDAFDFDPGELAADERVAPPLTWSDAGDALVFRIASTEPGEPGDDPAPDAEPDGEERSNVQIWHSKDYTLFPAQARGRGRRTDRPETAIVHLHSGALTRVPNADFEQVRLLPGETAALALDETPYDFQAMFGRGRRDVHLIDVAGGESRAVDTALLRPPQVSPQGRYLLYMKEHQYLIHDVAAGETRNLTYGLPTSFVNLDNDHPVPEQPGHGVAGWLPDDRAVIVYDRFDLWRLESDGSGAERLTDGRERGLVMRRLRLEDDEEHIDLGRPVYLSVSDPVSKQSGFAVLDGSRIEVPVLLDKAVGSLAKARDAQVYSYTIGSFDDSPDLFVGGPGLADARQVTDTNPFQQEYAWGRSEIVHYTTRRGLDLQGALFYPAGYQEGRRYPMIVYMYERVSQSVHRYVVPSETSPYNTTVFTSQGYFVLQPDIVFEARKPGPSVVDCVESAVGKVISMGVVDPDRIGCVGHSWGGFDASYLATHSDVFATAVAGAPVANLLTMWGTISEGGSPETSHNEVGQERMEVPWWVDLDAYIKSSPVHGIENLERPLLMAFGGSDGNVNPLLGYEFYNAARRLGKAMVLLVYPGENHSLRRRANQIDYQQRILEWFSTYLQGESPPAWITDGIRFEDIEAERERLRLRTERLRAGDAGQTTSGSGGGNGQR